MKGVMVMNPHEFLKGTKEFIEHNIGLGYISKDTTASELLDYIRKVDENYLPLMQTIKETIEKL